MFPAKTIEIDLSFLAMAVRTLSDLPEMYAPTGAS
jgi:hypothetical protein